MEFSQSERTALNTLERIYTALAESSLDDCELPGSRSEIADASLCAERVRASLLEGVRAFRQRALNLALASYREEVRRFKEHRFALPTTTVDRRELLRSVLERFPHGGRTFLTLQHRDFKNLSDGDVESLLKQLDALGVLNGER